MSMWGSLQFLLASFRMGMSGSAVFPERDLAVFPERHSPARFDDAGYIALLYQE